MAKKLYKYTLYPPFYLNQYSWGGDSKEAFNNAFNSKNAAGSIAGVGGALTSIIGAGMNNAKIADTSGIENNIKNVQSQTFEGSTNDQLLSSWGAFNPLDGVSYKDIRGGSNGSRVMSTLGSAISGAGAGASVGGPLGAVAGGVLGVGAGIWGLLSGNKKANAKTAELNAQIALANQQALNNFGNSVQNVDATNDMNLLANYSAYGGNIYGNGGYKPSNNIKNFIKLEEGFRDTIYLDGNGIPTIGYGFTDPKILSLYKNKKMSKAEADKIFEQELGWRSNEFKSRTPNFEKLNQDLKDSLLSYYYNYPANWKSGTKMILGLKNENWDLVAQNIDAGYNDKKNPGLKKRRDRERELFTKGFSREQISVQHPMAIQPQSFLYKDYIANQVPINIDKYNLTTEMKTPKLSSLKKQPSTFSKNIVKQPIIEDLNLVEKYGQTLSPIVNNTIMGYEDSINIMKKGGNINTPTSIGGIILGWNKKNKKAIFDNVLYRDDNKRVRYLPFSDKDGNQYKPSEIEWIQKSDSLNAVDHFKRKPITSNVVNTRAYGGHTHGAQWDNGVTTYDNGSTHELNPNGGIMIGVDPQGIPNMVEEGEVKFNDYIFSDRITIPKELKEQYKLKKNSTFADAAKKLSKESDERPNDPISKAGLNASMTKLTLMQEFIKEQLQPLQLEQLLLNAFAGGGFPKFTPGPMPIISESSNSYKSNDYSLNDANKIIGNNNPYMGVTEDYWNNEYKSALKNNTSSKQNFDKSLLRYAPVIGSGIGVFSDLMGWTNKPNYDNANMITDAVRNTPNVQFNPIGNQMTYKPLDRNYYLNQLYGNAGASRRDIINQSGGNRATAMAGILGADYNTTSNIGKLARESEEYNLNLRLKVEDFNRSTNMFNTEGSLKAQTANQANHERKLRAIMAASEMRLQADMLSSLGKSANLTNFFDNIGNIGREAFSLNLVNWEIDKGLHGGYSLEDIFNRRGTSKSLNLALARTMYSDEELRKAGYLKYGGKVKRKGLTF